MTAEPDQALYVISVAAELTGLSPQTLRAYEEKGLMAPERSGGGTRLYSNADLDRIRHIHDLAAGGLNLEGVRQVLVLEAEVVRLKGELDQIKDAGRRQVEAVHRHYRRDLVPAKEAFVLPIKLPPMSTTGNTPEQSRLPRQPRDQEG